MKKFNPMLTMDWYKAGHRQQYPAGTEMVYSTFTPRASRFPGVNHVVVFGFQAFIKEYLIKFWNDHFFARPVKKIVDEYRKYVENCLFIKNPDTQHIVDLHTLGHLPIRILALPEGLVSPIRCPILTIENTDPRFFWVTNYLETLMSTSLWQAITSATIAHEYRKMLGQYALDTVGDDSFVQFQAHDFSMRGMSSLESSIKSGMGHLLSFVGTDTVSAIEGAECFYNADVSKELIGASIPATEHSVQCSYADDYKYFDMLISKVYPQGFVSIVSDGYDFWNVVGNVLPKLKDKILARDGKTVIRPDSGIPELIVCGDPNGDTELERKGAVEALWDIFGGTITPKGYKLLNSKIGLIYGDSITYDRAKIIVSRLKNKGFASINCVFGVGSFTYQYNTRDTFGFALKSTYCVINGKEIPIFKDPKTDDGIKKSQRGRVAVVQDSDGSLRYIDGLSISDNIPGNLLRPIFLDGELLVDDSFATIRKRLEQSRKAEMSLKCC